MLKHITSLFIVVQFLIFYSGSASSQILDYPLHSDQHLTDQFHVTSVNTDFKEKNPTVAALLSVGITTGTVLSGYSLIKNENDKIGRWILFTGLLIGPSSGNLYAENHESVKNGVLTRLGGMALSTTGIYMMLIHSFDRIFGSPPYQTSDAFGVLGTTFFITGLGLYTYSTVYDIFNSAHNAKKYNAAQHKKLKVTPIYNPSNHSIGMNLRVRF